MALRHTFLVSLVGAADKGWEPETKGEGRVGRGAWGGVYLALRALDVPMA